MAGQEGRKRGGSNSGGAAKQVTKTEEKKQEAKATKSWRDVKNLEDMTAEQLQSISTQKEAQEFGNKFGLGEFQQIGSHISDGRLKWVAFEKDNTVKPSKSDFEKLTKTQISNSFNDWFKSNNGKLKGKDFIDIDSDSGFVTVWRSTKSAGGWTKDYFEPVSATKTTRTFITSSGKKQTEKLSISKSINSGMKNIKWEYVGSEDY